MVAFKHNTHIFAQTNPGNGNDSGPYTKPINTEIDRFRTLLSENDISRANHLSDEDLVICAINALSRPTDFFLPNPPVPEDILEIKIGDIKKEMVLISEDTDPLYIIHRFPEFRTPILPIDSTIEISTSRLNQLEPYARYVEYLNLLQESSRFIAENSSEHQTDLALHTAKVLAGKWVSTESPFQDRFAKLVRITRPQYSLFDSSFMASLESFPNVEEHLNSNATIAIINPGLAIFEQLRDLRYAPATFIVIDDNPFVVETINQIGRLSGTNKYSAILAQGDNAPELAKKINCVLYLAQPISDALSPEWVADFANKNINRLDGIVIGAEPSNTFDINAPAPIESSLRKYNFNSNSFVKSRYKPPYFSGLRNRLALSALELHNEWLKQEKQAPVDFNVFSLRPL